MKRVVWLAVAYVLFIIIIFFFFKGEGISSTNLKLLQDILEFSEQFHSNSEFDAGLYTLYTLAHAQHLSLLVKPHEPTLLSCAIGELRRKLHKHTETERLRSPAYAAAVQNSKLNRSWKALYHKLTTLLCCQLSTAPSSMTNQPEQ